MAGETSRRTILAATGVLPLVRQVAAEESRGGVSSRPLTVTSGQHKEVADVAGNRGAMVVATQLLERMALNGLRQAVQFGIQSGAFFRTANTAVGGRYSGISIDPKLIHVQLEQDSNGLFLHVTPSFTVSLELFYPVNPSLVYSEVTIEIPEVYIDLSGASGGTNIQFEIRNDLLVNSSVRETSSRGAAMTASGISTQDLLRVEGAVAYGGVGARLTLSAFGKLEALDLRSLFPALEFGGDLNLFKTSAALVVVPDSLSVIDNIGCPQGDATAGLSVTPQAGPTTQGNKRAWDIVGHIRPSAPNRPPVSSQNGIASVYLPKPLLDVRFGKAAPAITYNDHGGGFITYDLELAAAIKEVAVTIDPVEKALRLVLQLNTWGSVVANIDVPCVGSVELAQARLKMPDDGTSSRIEALLRLAVDTAGRLLLVAELGAVDLGKAAVSVHLFSKYLGLAGGETAVTGFILDTVIGRIVANNLPGIVFDAIKSSVNQHFMTLANLAKLLKVLDHRPNIPTFSADSSSQSVLVGLTISV